MGVRLHAVSWSYHTKDVLVFVTDLGTLPSSVSGTLVARLACPSSVASSASCLLPVMTSCCIYKREAAHRGHGGLFHVAFCFFPLTHWVHLLFKRILVTIETRIVTSSCFHSHIHASQMTFIFYL